MNGIIYIVTGNYHSQECIESIKSIRDHSGIPITVFSDKNVFGNSVNFVEIKKDISPFKNKVKYLMDSPYDRTLFLDSDTLVVKPINELFDMLDKYDLCVPPCPNIDWSKPIGERNGQQIFRFRDYVATGYYSSGIILYKKSDIFKEIWNNWKGLYFDIEDSLLNSVELNDQTAFNKLIRNNPHYLNNIGVIDNKIYHATCCMLSQLRADNLIQEVKLYHSHSLIRYRGQVYWKGEDYLKESS